MASETWAALSSAKGGPHGVGEEEDRLVESLHVADDVKEAEERVEPRLWPLSRHACHVLHGGGEGGRRK